MSIRGYAEGFYGRLLSWDERHLLLKCLYELGLNTYYYAPKEDIYHRWQWREPYSSTWREQFRSFCQEARKRNIQVIAGIAPGLDFDFRHLTESGPDFNSLLAKARQLLADGADAISLLLDDIDEKFDQHRAGFESEGLAHASLANALARELAVELPKPFQRASQSGTTSVASIFWVTPRVYADELIESSPDYLPDFLRELDSSHGVLYCGSDVVCRDVSTTFDRQIRLHSCHRVLVWDNLYANDYCPRRLFVGPWLGRETVVDVLLNPTGLVYTDCLLLDMMASFTVSTGALSAQSSKPIRMTDEDGEKPWHEVWRKVLRRHDVPDCFDTIAEYFDRPVFNDQRPLISSELSADAQVFDAIEQCLWNWKSPLSREWYPFVFGLKHDLLIRHGQLPTARIRKTQNIPLAERLLNSAE